MEATLELERLDVTKQVLEDGGAFIGRQADDARS